VRKGVGADAEIDPGGAIPAEILQYYAAPRKNRRAVRDRGAGFGKMGEVVAGRPVQPGMMVEKDRMGDDRVCAEHADLAQPFDWRFAVPPHDLVKLDNALRRMDLQRQPAFAGRRGAFAQQRPGAGIDLGRIESTIEPARRMLTRPLDKAERAVEPVPPNLLVPLVAHLVAVRRVPAAGAEHRRELLAERGLDISYETVCVGC
jgi:hypothetical protein